MHRLAICMPTTWCRLAELTNPCIPSTQRDQLRQDSTTTSLFPRCIAGSPQRNGASAVELTSLLAAVQELQLLTSHKHFLLIYSWSFFFYCYPEVAFFSGYPELSTAFSSKVSHIFLIVHTYFLKKHTRCGPVFICVPSALRLRYCAMHSDPENLYIFQKIFW